MLRPNEAVPLPIAWAHLYAAAAKPFTETPASGTSSPAGVINRSVALAMISHKVVNTVFASPGFPRLPWVVRCPRPGDGVGIKSIPIRPEHVCQGHQATPPGVIDPARIGYGYRVVDEPQPAGSRMIAPSVRWPADGAGTGSVATRKRSRPDAQHLLLKRKCYRNHRRLRERRSPDPR